MPLKPCARANSSITSGWESDAPGSLRLNLAHCPPMHLRNFNQLSVFAPLMKTKLLFAVAVLTGLLAQRSGGEDFKLPTKVGETVTIDIPGLPAGAKKLEFVFVPGRGEVKSFLLGKYEVTQGQYEAVMHKNPSTFKKGPDYPVEQLSWQDSKDFCARLQA